MKTKSEFRVVYYDHAGKRHTVYPETSAEDSEDAMGEKLEHYLESAYGTGGHLEAYLGEPIGWVLAD